MGARFGSTYTKIGTIQRRLAWPLCKDDMQIREAFHIKKKKSMNISTPCLYEKVHMSVDHKLSKWTEPSSSDPVPGQHP